jgi:hypothetical protein
MRIYAARLGPFLLFSAILVCFAFLPLRVCGQGGSGSKPIPIEQMGTGLFAAVPFKLTLDVRGGYDDNVTTFQPDKRRQQRLRHNY